MAPAYLDLNDCNLQLWHREAHVQSPGYAQLRGRDYVFGGPARAAARLRPRDINTRYWWQLSTEPLQPALGPARHTGDLAHAHLVQLHAQAGEPGEVVLAVSGSMQREQLALLLGIVQQCPFDAVGLVNRSAALGSLHCDGGRLWHLELQLHQALLSQLQDSGGTVQVERTLPLPGCGLLQLQERLVEAVAAAFVRQTRFDPRRQAVTEQALYDALPAALAALQRESETNVEVGGYRARLNARELAGAVQRLFDSARDSLGAATAEPILAEPLAALLPGIHAAFPGLRVAAADHVRSALEAHGEALLRRDGHLSFVTALPRLDGPGAAAAAAPSPAAARERPAVAQPTHLLRGDRALPLAPGGTELGRGWALVRDGGHWRLRGAGDGATLNGAPCADGQAVAVGDRIAIGDGEGLRLIEVAG